MSERAGLDFTTLRRGDVWADVPMGTVTLFFNVSGAELRVPDPRRPGSTTVAAPAWVAGPLDGPSLTEGPADAGFLRVELSPWDAYRLLGGIPLGEIVNADIPMDELLGRWPTRMLDRLQHAENVHDRVGHLRAGLAARLRTGPAPDPAVLHIWRRIHASGGTVRIGDLAEVGWTRRHLARKFAQQIGLAPKTVARIRRLHVAIHLLGTGAESAMGHLAVRAGYSDQSHLVREMRALTGSTPGQLFSDLANLGADGMSHSFKTRPAAAN
jgi:AraC-like DNA-binding protein